MVNLIRETEEFRGEETWGWIRKGYLKKETEGLIFAEQEKALRTNWIRKNIDVQEVSEKYRMCWERDESITHLIAEYQNLAQKGYKQRHDKTARTVHLELCQKFGLVGKVKWYNHKTVLLFSMPLFPPTTVEASLISTRVKIKTKSVETSKNIGA